MLPIGEHDVPRGVELLASARKARCCQLPFSHRGEEVQNAGNGTALGALSSAHGDAVSVGIVLRVLL